MKLILIILSLFWTSAGFASSEITVSGKVIRFDEKIIVLKQKSGGTVNIPRSSQKGMKGVRVGQDILELKLQPVDYIRLNPIVLSSPPVKKKTPIKK
jgi:hypothetical protein